MSKAILTLKASKNPLYLNTWTPEMERVLLETVKSNSKYSFEKTPRKIFDKSVNWDGVRENLMKNSLFPCVPAPLRLKLLFQQKFQHTEEKSEVKEKLEEKTTTGPRNYVAFTTEQVNCFIRLVQENSSRNRDGISMKKFMASVNWEKVKDEMQCDLTVPQLRTRYSAYLNRDSSFLEVYNYENDEMLQRDSILNNSCKWTIEEEEKVLSHCAEVGFSKKYISQNLAKEISLFLHKSKTPNQIIYRWREHLWPQKIQMSNTEREGRSFWTPEQDATLLEIMKRKYASKIQKYSSKLQFEPHFSNIEVEGKTSEQCQRRFQFLDPRNMVQNRFKWGSDEEKTLIKLVKSGTYTSWLQISKTLQFLHPTRTFTKKDCRTYYIFLYWHSKIYHLRYFKKII